MKIKLILIAAACALIGAGCGQIQKQGQPNNEANQISAPSELGASVEIINPEL